MTSTPPPGWKPGEHWSYSGSGPGGPTPARRERRRRQAGDPNSLLKIVYGLAVLLIAIVGFSWLHGGEEADLNPIAEAAERTEAMAGSRIAATVLYEYAPGTRLEASGEGAVDLGSERSSLTLEMRLPNGELTFETVGEGTRVYMRSPALEPELPDGKEWMSFDAFLGEDPESALAGAPDARQQLQLLRAAGGDVEKVGEEDVRGVPTERYRATVDLDDAAADLRRQGEPGLAKAVERAAAVQPGPIPVEVWIGEDGTVRRMREVMTMASAPGARGFEMDMRIEYFDFGPQPEIEIPAESVVFDATPMVRAELGLSRAGKRGGRAAGDRPKPAAAPAVGEFHAEARAVCVDMKTEFEQLKRTGDPLVERWSALAKSKGLDSAATLRAGREAASGYFEPIVPLVGAGLDRLEQIEAPPRLSRSYRRYLALGRAQVELLRVETRALQAGDYQLLSKLSDRFDRLGKPTKRLARELGILNCEDIDEG